MENNLYRIEVIAWDNLPNINTTGMLYTNEGMAFVKLHPVKLNVKSKSDTKEVIHSMWTLNKDGSGTCQNCHRTTKNVWDYDSWMRYCPDCGARMDGGNE